MADKYEYRAGWKEGVYQFYARQSRQLVAVTLTTSQEAHSASYINRQISRHMADTRADGLVLVEEGRGDGRLHAHGLLVDGVAAEAFISNWTRTIGFVVVKPLTDLMGWITYMFKAFHSETVWTWRKDGRHAKSGEIHRAVRDTPVTETLAPQGTLEEAHGASQDHHEAQEGGT